MDLRDGCDFFCMDWVAWEDAVVSQRGASIGGGGGVDLRGCSIDSLIIK